MRCHNLEPEERNGRRSGGCKEKCHVFRRGPSVKGKKAEEEESRPPPEEDKFEYKLVGITVHSGTAHAGHYWAYINTARGEDGPPEGADDAAWASSENARWREFNDSNVRDFA